MEFDDYDIDFLKTNIPLFGETISQYSIELYRVTESIVELSGGGMGGLSFKNSTEETASLIERYGFKYEFVKDFILEFEAKLYKEYSDILEKE